MKVITIIFRIVFVLIKMIINCNNDDDNNNRKNYDD